MFCPCVVLIMKNTDNLIQKYFQWSYTQVVQANLIGHRGGDLFKVVIFTLKEGGVPSVNRQGN